MNVNGPRMSLIRISMALLLAVALLPLATPLAASASTVSCMARWPSPTWVLTEPYDADVDVAGNVYVVSTGDASIRKYDAEGSLITSWGSYGTGNGAFKTPKAVAVSPDGLYVYVADTGNHRVQMFSADGQWQATWGRQGSPDLSGSGPGEFFLPQGIAVDPTGRVHVADTGNARIQRFSATGEYQMAWGSPGSNDDQFIEPVALDIDAAGDVFVVDRNQTNSRVQRFDADGVHKRTWSAYGWGQGFLRYPEGIAVGPDGYVYVSDTATGEIERFTGEGVSVDSWGVKIAGDYFNGQPAMLQPRGIVAYEVEGSTRILVVETANERLREYSPAGTTLSIRGSWGAGEGRMQGAAGIALDAEGNVIVAESENHRVQKFGSDGTWTAMTPTLIPPFARVDNGWFNMAMACAVDATGNVYVAEKGNNRIQKLSPGLGYLTKWGAAGSGAGFFSGPCGVAVESLQGVTRVYVADTQNNRIQVFDELGAYLTSWGTFGSSPGQFNKPEGIAVSPDGESVYVADTGNHRVQRFGPYGGAAVEVWGAQGAQLGQFTSPKGLAVGPDGAVYVADTENDRIQMFAEGGTQPTAVWGSPGSEAGQFDAPRGIAVAQDGRVYVADEGNHRVQVFTAPIGVFIDGVADGMAYNNPVSPHVTFTGTDLTEQSITLNGSEWTPEPLDTEGTYALEAWAENVHGDRGEAAVSFTLDFTKPHTVSNAQAEYDDRATIMLTPSDALSGVGGTYWRLDGAIAVRSSTVYVSEAATHTLEFWSVDRAGNEEDHHQATFRVIATGAAGAGCERVGGLDRYATAAGACASQFATGSCDSVVIATGQNFPDALAASGLAGAVDGPLLLTKREALPAPVLAEVRRVTQSQPVRRAYLVGGTGAVSTEVGNALQAEGFQVTRIAGANRYDTAARIARQMRTLMGAEFDARAFLVRGDSFADALAVGPVAYRLKAPVLLTQSTALDDYAQDAIDYCSIDKITVLGGTGAVSGGVESLARDLPSVTSVDRVGGGDRYATSALLADYVTDSGECGFGAVGVASGLSFPDALAAGPVIGARGGVLLLCAPTSVPSSVAAALTTHKAEVIRLTVFGGTGAVSAPVYNQLLDLLE